MSQNGMTLKHASGFENNSFSDIIQWVTGHRVCKNLAPRKLQRFFFGKSTGHPGPGVIWSNLCKNRPLKDNAKVLVAT